MFPYLRVKGAVEKFRLTEPGATGLVIHLHCDNCDEPAARAVAAGAVMVREPSEDMPPIFWTRLSANLC